MNKILPPPYFYFMERKNFVVNYAVLECYQILSEEECFAAIEANNVVRVQNDADQEQMTIDAHISVTYKNDETLVVKCKRGFTPALSLHIKPVFKSVLGHYGRVSISEERENRDKYTVYEVSLFPKYYKSSTWSIEDMRQTLTRDLKLKIRNVAGIGAIIAMVVTVGASGIILRAAVKKENKELAKFDEEFSKRRKELDEEFNKTKEEIEVSKKRFDSMRREIDDKIQHTSGNISKLDKDSKEMSNYKF